MSSAVSGRSRYEKIFDADGPFDSGADGLLKFILKAPGGEVGTLKLIKEMNRRIK